MNPKLTLILSLAVIVSFLILPSVSAQSNPTINEITCSITGYDSGAGLYVTAPQDTQVAFIPDFYLNVSAPGNSSVTVDAGNITLAQQTFSYQALVYLNTSFNNSVVDLTVTVQSSMLGMSRQFFYILDFLTPQHYINYENTQVNTNKAVLIPLPTSVEQFGAAFLFGGLLVLGFVLAFHNAILANPRGRRLFNPKGKNGRYPKQTGR